MICEYRYCELEVPANRDKYCSKECNMSEYRILLKSGKAVKSDLKPSDFTQNGNECKWCMDSEHTKFCCPAHRSQYKQFRKGFDIEMARQKPEITDKQKKEYKKLQGILSNVIVNR